VTTPAASRPTHVRYYVLAALCGVTVINYVQRNSVGSLATSIRNGLEIDKRPLAVSGFLLFLAYALLQIPTGKLAQRWGPRKALTAFTVGWSLTTVALALVGGVWDLAILRTLLGALQAGIFPCATLIMAAWLPSSQRALASALLNSFMLIGGGGVYILTGLLLKSESGGFFEWRALFVIYAIPGLIWAAWFYWWFRDRPAEHAAANDAERELIAAGQPEAKSSFATVGRWAILLSVPLWLLCAQQTMRAGSNRFLDQWLSTYLQEETLGNIADSTEREKYAGLLTAFPIYIGVISGPIGGIISDWLLRRTGRRRVGRNGVAVASLGLAIVCFLPILFVHNAETQIVFFTLGMLVATCAAPCAYALSMDISGRNLPVVFGAMNMFGNLGAAVITGIVPDLNKLSGLGWRASILLFVAIHAVALVCWLFLNPNRTVGERA
jgi:MFS family permease